MVLVTLGVGMISFEEPLVAFAPVAVVVVLNTIEGQLVTPMLLGARMRLSAPPPRSAAWGARRGGAPGQPGRVTHRMAAARGRLPRPGPRMKSFDPAGEARTRLGGPRARCAVRRMSPRPGRRAFPRHADPASAQPEESQNEEDDDDGSDDPDDIVHSVLLPSEGRVLRSRRPYDRPGHGWRTPWQRSRRKAPVVIERAAARRSCRGVGKPAPFGGFTPGQCCAGC